MPKLFIMRSGAIGDFVLTLPALSVLRQKFRSHHGVLAARADALPLAHGVFADETIPFDSQLLTPLFAPDDRAETASEPLATTLSDVDLAVLWLPENTGRIVANNLRRFDVARLLCANPTPSGAHAADHLVDSLAPLGLIQPERAPHLPLSDSLRALADDFWQAHALAGTQVAAIHVGSGGERKRWSPENFLSLARRLATTFGMSVLLISGPAEQSSHASIRTPAEKEIVLLESPPLVLLASMLARCRIYVGNDSGITHLAAALGIPTVALFGPTSPDYWAPRGRHVAIVRSPTDRMEDLAVETVWESVSIVFARSEQT